jgi:hypothetical protein
MNSMQNIPVLFYSRLFYWDRLFLLHRLDCALLPPQALGERG